MTITIRGQILAALRNNPGLNSARIATMIGMTTKKISGPLSTLFADGLIEFEGKHGPPMSGSQSRAKGSSIALVGPVEFGTASWRRAVLSLEVHQKSWLLWNYSENTRFEYQVAITQWAWAEFREQLGAKKVAGKTMERLKKLIWLAAQDVKAELAGRETYEYQALAELVGVTPKNWSETFTDRWVEMRCIFLRLDSGALLQVTRSRSQQKATNFDRSLAKLD